MISALLEGNKYEAESESSVNRSQPFSYANVNSVTGTLMFQTLPLCSRHRFHHSVNTALHNTAPFITDCSLIFVNAESTCNLAIIRPLQKNFPVYGMWTHQEVYQEFLKKRA